jgi:hypothetical protein
MFPTGQSDELSQELAELYNLAEQIRSFSETPGERALLKQDLEEKMREYVERARKLAEKFGPSSMTISVGFPWGAQISLTWAK